MSSVAMAPDVVVAERATRPSTLVSRSLWRTFRIGKNDVHALRGVNLDVRTGEFVAIMGPSGCGKSTLLHTFGGLLAPTRGEVFVEGHELSGLSDFERTELRRKRIGFVFQRFNLLPTLSIEGNLRLAQRICLGPERARDGKPRRDELLALLGLEGKRDHRPVELSGGEQQRAAIARALLHEPAILLADEPTGNLDSSNTDSVLELLGDVHRQLGQTIVLITHDIDVAEASERIVLMKDGAILER